MSGFRNLALIFLACTLLLSSSCAPTEDEILTERTVQREGNPGVFLDSAVAGVSYSTSAGLGGFTDSDGTFYYKEGDTVSFSIGDISLGSVVGAAKLTPVEVMSASGTADQKVINLSRLLQTLDADGDPSNGINIEESTRTSMEGKTVNFDVPLESFAQETQAVTATVGREMISAKKALKHLHNTLEGEGLSDKVASDTELQGLSEELEEFITLPAGIALSKESLAVEESGNSKTFTVRLESEPYNVVVLSVTASDSSEVSVSPSSLGFGTDNFSTFQTVTVTGVNDNIRDDTINSSVIVGVNQDETKDSDYDDLGSKYVAVTTGDNEGLPLVKLRPTPEVTIGEDGEKVTFTLSMDPPAGTSTTISLSVSEGNGATSSDYQLSSASVVIPAESKTSTFTVSSKADEIDEGDGSSNYEFVTIAINGVSGGNGASEEGTQSTKVIIKDDDEAGFTMVGTSAPIKIDEQGNSVSSFTVQLNSQPLGKVVVSLNDGDDTESTYSPGTLTFTPENWNQPQTITLTAKQDSQDDDDQTTTITVGVSTSGSADSTYAGGTISSQSVTVTTVNTDKAGFTIAETGAATSVTEAGGTDKFTVTLDSVPTGDVVFTLTPSDNTEASVSVPTSPLTFTSSDWDKPKTVTVTGLDDDIDDGNFNSTIKVEIDKSNTTDPKYDDLSSKTVSVTNVDDDTSNFTITETSGGTSATEGGNSDTFTVQLASRPTGSVVLSVQANNDADVSVSPTTLSFDNVSSS